MMNVQCYTAPTIEPITLAELKAHLKVNSGTFDGNLAITQSLAYGSHAVADNYTTHVGIGVEVLGHEVEVLLHCGTNGAMGTNDTKIQESDQLATGYTDWSGGAFTQVTTANDNTDYKKQYTGTKRYIRTVSKVLNAACEFGTSILVNEAVTADDDNLIDLITEGREEVEKRTRRKLLTQVWDYYLDKFPAQDFIKLPFGNLQNSGDAVPVITYTDSDGNTTTMVVTTDYLVETNGEQCGRIVLPYGVSWPTATLYPSHPIKIRFTCGWTDAGNIPKNIKRAVKFACEDAYYHGDRHDVLNRVIDALVADYRLWEEF